MSSDKSDPVTKSSKTHYENVVDEALYFKYVPAYAKYLLENKLEEFTNAQLDFSKQIKLPLLSRLKDVSKKQLKAFCFFIANEMLNACIKNEAGTYIKKILEKWIYNQLPFISKNQIEAEDITLLSFIQRNALKKFITGYTANTDLANQVLYETDFFITTIETACVTALFKTQQELFTQAQQLSHTGNWHWDLRTNKLFWSNEIYNIYELPHQSEIMPEDIGRYNHPADDASIDWHLSTSIQSLLPHNFFYRIIFADGRQKVLHSKGEVKYDEQGNAIEMLGTLQDVTDQKQKEKQLEESNRFIEKITDISPCIISVYNIRKKEYVYVNNGATAIMGYKPEDFFKNGRAFFFSRVHEDDVITVQKNIEHMIEEANCKEDTSPEKLYEFKYRFKRSDNIYKWLYTYCTAFTRDSNNKVVEILNVSIDITESEQLTRQLEIINEEVRYKELQHQRMISEVEDYSIILMDKDGVIQNWNKGAEKIKGYAANEIIGKNFRLFYRQQDKENKLPEMLLEEAITKGRAQHEGWRVRKDGSTFWGNVVITALHDENNNLIGFSKVTRNLTEKKLAEDKLRQYAATTEKHNEELQRMNKELDSFTYMASHDLQEPLRKIRTFCNIILTKAADDFSAEIKNYFDRVIASAGRMQTLIDSLLNYSRAGKTEINLQPVALSVIIEEVKKELAEKIEEKKAVITYSGLPLLRLEHFQFHQLFFNLIDNSLKYSQENAPLQISITATVFLKEDEEAKPVEFTRIKFTDNGIGFEQQYAENIFKLFQRLHGKSEYSGTGIGLAICKKIVENHKGTITAFGKPGEGSSFIIEMPTGTGTI